MYNGHFYCGDEETDCYVSEEQAQSVLGDADIVRFFVQCSRCGEHDFFSAQEKQEHLCPVCQVYYACETCRTEFIDNEYNISWKCSCCILAEKEKREKFDFNKRWNDYLDD
jgi:phage terminase large subunit GpA-like protein